MHLCIPKMITMRYFRPFIAASLLLMTTVLSSSAQTTAADVGFTPYSIFGLGDLAKQGSAYNRSMGGIGIGDRNQRYINYLNPAAVTARQPKSFMMDFGLQENNMYYAANSANTDNVLHSVDNTFNMDHLVLSFPIENHSAFLFGVKPFSNTGYSFLSNEDSDELVSEMGEIQYTQVGQGGLTEAFVGAGATFFKRLSIGVDGQYFFGNINRYSAASFITSSSYRTINSGWNYSLKGFGAKFGMQYEQPIGKKYEATLGATYSLGSKIGGEVTRFAYGILSSTDTIVNKKMDVDGFSIPSEIGAGFTFKKKDESWMFGFDYSQQDWSSAKLFETPGSGFAAAKQQSFRAGFEFTPNRYDMRYWYKHITYRGGCYHEKSYYSFNGKQVDATGITFGVSFPVFRYFNSVNLGVDIGQRGSLAADQIRERYFLFNVSFALHDIWFLKPLYD